MITPIVFLVLNLAIIGAFVWTRTKRNQARARVGKPLTGQPAYAVLLSVLAPITTVIAIGWNLSLPGANVLMAIMLAIWIVYWSRRLAVSNFDFPIVIDSAGWARRLSYMALAYSLINLAWLAWLASLMLRRSGQALYLHTWF